MKPNPEREELLHELLDESTARGPSADAVLQLVRAEQARRHRHRTLAGAVAGLAVLGVVLQLTSYPDSRVASRVAPAPPAEPFAVKRVTDEEFLTLLAQQDQPVALMKLPNGERQLLMVVHQTDTASQPD